MEEEEERAEQEEDKEKREPAANGWEVGYRLFSINGRALGHGEPVRVRQGERVLFHILNASATENVKLALPGHRFLVVALDGNLVPTLKHVDVLRLGAAERIDAIVEMNHPGVWIFGTPRDDDRKNGMGVVVEYAGAGGDPQWVSPPRKSKWDYTIFGSSQPAQKTDQVIPMTFRKINGGKGGFNRWTINGKSYEDQSAPTKLQKGLRYRLALDNRTDDPHPLHLHRNVFELTNVDGRPTAGVKKDVVVIRGFGRVDIDFTADQPGLSLFHCHHQLHMDYGFMQLFDVV
ncbi:multicopper oxidase domain-containing protein [Methylocystis hirsuta]|nr:multicopper oxidase domain-containing protein [Methylocystis hirsuta]